MGIYSGNFHTVALPIPLLGARTRSRANNKLNPHDAGSRNRTQATLLGGKHSHHCTIPAPPNSEQNRM